MVWTDQVESTLTPESPRIAGYELETVVSETLAYCRERNYRGWDYCDGMDSRIRRALPVDNRWLNLVFQESAKRSPLNLRPLLLVEQRRNFMGIALFTLANLNLLAIERTRGVELDSVDFEDEATQLADWLLANQSIGYAGFCGGHKHAIQKLDGKKGHPNDPDVVTTSYGVKALLATAHLDAEYARQAETAADFVNEDLDYRPAGNGAEINYHMNHADSTYTLADKPESHYTLNPAAIGSRLFVDLAAATGTSEYEKKATALLNPVARLQTDAGGWYYRDPPDASHLSMDNHHNAFIIESFLRYQTAFDDSRYVDTIADALDFFETALVDETGAPNFDESNRYPRDVHAAANSILLFTYAGNLSLAERVLAWTLENLYAGDGRFYYRKRRYYTERTTLMRWGQAWMAFAMTEYLTTVRLGSDHTRFIDP